jgi:hypothetical protein
MRRVTDFDLVQFDCLWRRNAGALAVSTTEQFWDSFSRYRPSAWALVLANIAPLFGVIVLGWEAFDVVALYWAENVIIGAVNVLKIITCNPDLERMDWANLVGPGKQGELQKLLQEGGAGGKANMAIHGAKLLMVPFFAVHYGMFCFVHGTFVIVMLGPGGMFRDPFDQIGQMIQLAKENHLFWAIAALAASHFYSFFYNYLGHGENRRTLPIILMFQPYARVVVLHIAILFGGFVAMGLGSGMGLLVLLIVGKTILDLNFHFRERRRSLATVDKRIPDEVMASH